MHCPTTLVVCICVITWYSIMLTRESEPRTEPKCISKNVKDHGNELKHHFLSMSHCQRPWSTHLRCCAALVCESSDPWRLTCSSLVLVPVSLDNSLSAPEDSGSWHNIRSDQTAGVQIGRWLRTLKNDDFEFSGQNKEMAGWVQAVRVITGTDLALQNGVALLIFNWTCYHSPFLIIFHQPETIFPRPPEI